MAFEQFNGRRIFVFAMDEHADIAIFQEILDFLGGPFKFEYENQMFYTYVKLSWQEYNDLLMMGYNRYMSFEQFFPSKKKVIE